MKKYTTADIVSLLGKNERTIRRWISDLVGVDKGKYTVSEDILKLLEIRASADNLRTNIGQPADNDFIDEFDYYEAFTADEYIEFQKRINEYPVLKEYIESLKEQIEFLRFNTAQQNEVIRDLSAGIKQRNFIEAKEKGFDNE
jgi:ABC-type multidrug transport system ATPase subunit